jgi:UDP-galactopyranose mutase
MSYLIVGSGLYGATFARVLAENNKKVFVIDKREHIGGNCYTEKVNGINVHKYGPHAFHTNSDKVWEFVNNFSEFNDFKLKVKVNYKDNFYSFPINLFTLNQIYGIRNQTEAKSILSKIIIRNKKSNFKNFVISKVGRELYEIFYEGYTKKQWDIEPENLPATIAKRIPIRYDFNDYYFTDKYQGIPINGYTNLIENILDHK